VYGDVVCFKQCPRLRSVQFVGCRQVRGNVRVFEATPHLWRLFFYHSQLAGMLSPTLVQLISAARRRGGEVRLWKCGRFVLPSDLSEVAGSLAHVDLSGITSLEGSLKCLAQLPRLESVSFEHCPALHGDLSVFEKLAQLKSVKLEGCEAVTGNVAALKDCTKLEHVDLTNTGVEGSVSVFEKLAASHQRLKKVKVGGTKCFEGLPPTLRASPFSSPQQKRVHGSF
jgi:hypothetical protein